MVGCIGSWVRNIHRKIWRGTLLDSGEDLSHVDVLGMNVCLCTWVILYSRVAEIWGAKCYSHLQTIPIYKWGQSTFTNGDRPCLQMGTHVCPCFQKVPPMLLPRPPFVNFVFLPTFSVYICPHFSVDIYDINICKQSIICTTNLHPTEITLILIFQPPFPPPPSKLIWIGGLLDLLLSTFLCRNLSAFGNQPTI